MLIWENQIINLALEYDYYEELRHAGWEPYHFVLVPAPVVAGGGLVTSNPNGAVQPTGMTMVNIVGMRRQIDDGVPLPFELDADEEYVTVDLEGLPMIDATPEEKAILDKHRAFIKRRAI